MKRPKYQIINIDDLVRIVQNIVKNYEEIQLVYLYGSYAAGLETEYSDIDIGVVLDKNFKEFPLYFAELSSKIEKCFDFKINIDLRILNECAPRFLFKVIKKGRCIYSKSRTILSEFEIKVLYEYQDIKPMLDMYDNIIVKKVLGD